MTRYRWSLKNIMQPRFCHKAWSHPVFLSQSITKLLNLDKEHSDVRASNLPFILPVFWPALLKVTNNEAILRIPLFIKKPFCCKSVGKSLFRQEEHPLEEKKLTLTDRCRWKSKNLDGRRKKSQSNDLLQVFSCLNKVWGKKSKERYRSRQK